jgi:hypothetical protein
MSFVYFKFGVFRLWMERWIDKADSFTWRLKVFFSMSPTRCLLLFCRERLSLTHGDALQILTSGSAHIRLLVASHFGMASSSETVSSPVNLSFCVARFKDCLPTFNTTNRGSGNRRPDCRLTCVTHVVQQKDIPVMFQMEREHISDTMYLHEGRAYARLCVAEGSSINLAFFSAEIVLEHAWQEIVKEKRELVADISWMRDHTSYALFFHWNSYTMPISGERLPYEQAVHAFDVDQFATQVQASGAQLVVFTTSWAGFYFPGPISAIDQVLKGRTTERDLIADLAVALQQRSIRLMLYYHYGKDDSDWFSRVGFGNDYRNEKFWQTWIDIISEVGMRYGELLSGWWIDDGTIGYYPRSPPFRRMWRALKAGHAQRLVGYNPWMLPSCTVLQDLYLGEMAIADSLFVKNLDHGIFIDGSHQGLYATFSSMLQPNHEWTYMRGGSVDASSGGIVWAQGQDTGFPPMMAWQDLFRGVLEARRKATLPILNLLISQEGFVCPTTLATLASLARHLQQDVQGYNISHNDSTELHSSLAILGPDAERAPVFWSKEHVLVAWDSPGAFAAWTIFPGGLRGHLRVALRLKHMDASVGFRVSVAMHLAAGAQETASQCARSPKAALQEIQAEIHGPAPDGQVFVGILELPDAGQRFCLVLISHGSSLADMYLSAVILQYLDEQCLHVT